MPGLLVLLPFDFFTAGAALRGAGHLLRLLVDVPDQAGVVLHHRPDEPPALRRKRVPRANDKELSFLLRCRLVRDFHPDARAGLRVPCGADDVRPLGDVEDQHGHRADEELPDGAGHFASPPMSFLACSRATWALAIRSFVSSGRPALKYALRIPPFDGEPISMLSGHFVSFTTTCSVMSLPHPVRGRPGGTGRGRRPQALPPVETAPLCLRGSAA